ncbi:RNA 2'-phosphotransferase [uncultured Megasphaera sp.]|uniref:RNA 2'-phosphotransferase n=1 Tax=uncultured Megasphaera sp. TaxID=165188 RepID=UPI0025913B0A|nr:RNA 2'-phosphotransferase [uncultured Megasphaera sp.]
MNNNRTSKFIALILRHKPEVIGISLDEHGWAEVDALVAGIAKQQPFTREMLEDIVKTDSKGRYSFNEDKTLIRANQGHSVSVDVELERKRPPDVLWHGTGEKYAAAIDGQGLISKSRLYVHLSADYETAVAVGRRHGRPVVYQIDTNAMAADGYVFYLSVNGVWLTKAVPAKYIKRVPDGKKTK